jgi:hypothetical protein
MIHVDLTSFAAFKSQVQRQQMLTPNHALDSFAHNSYFLILLATFDARSF